jgi:hypothetical protein
MMQMTGAAQRLNQLLAKFEPELQFFQKEIYPKIQQLKQLEATWEHIKSTLSPEQKESMEKHGYAAMNSRQAEMAYGNARGLLSIFEQNVYQKSMRKWLSHLKNKFHGFEEMFFS